MFTFWVQLGCDDLCPSLEVYLPDPHEEFDPAEERKTFGEANLRPTIAHILCLAGCRFGLLGVQEATSDRHYQGHAGFLPGISSAGGGDAKWYRLASLHGRRMSVGPEMQQPPLDELFLRPLEHGEKIWE
jgi:hypothetical protein